MGKCRRGLIVPFVLATLMIVAIIAALLNRHKEAPKDVIVETSGQESPDETETYMNYTLTDPIEKLEIQGSEISHEPETLKSNQLEDIINFIAANIEEGGR